MHAHPATLAAEFAALTGGRLRHGQQPAAPLRPLRQPRDLEVVRAELAAAMAGHDQSGQYADDHGVWVVWSERQQRIDALRRELGAE